MENLVSLDAVRCFVPETYRQNATIKYGDPGYQIDWKDNTVEVTVGRLAADGLVKLQIALASVQDPGNQTIGGKSDDVVPLQINKEVIEALIPAHRIFEQIITLEMVHGERSYNGFIRPGKLALCSTLSVGNFNSVAKELQDNKPNVAFELNGVRYPASQPITRRQAAWLLSVATLTLFLGGLAAGYGLHAFFHPAPIGPVYR